MGLGLGVFDSKKRYDWFVQFWIGIAAWFGAMYLCWNFFTPVGTFFVWILPHFVGMSAMALGNYAQHVIDILASIIVCLSSSSLIPACYHLVVIKFKKSPACATSTRKMMGTFYYHHLPAKIHNFFFSY